MHSSRDPPVAHIHNANQVDAPGAAVHAAVEHASALHCIAQRAPVTVLRLQMGARPHRELCTRCRQVSSSPPQRCACTPSNCAVGMFDTRFDGTLPPIQWEVGQPCRDARPHSVRAHSPVLHAPSALACGGGVCQKRTSITTMLKASLTSEAQGSSEQ